MKRVNKTCSCQNYGHNKNNRHRKLTLANFEGKLVKRVHDLEKHLSIRDLLHHLSASKFALNDGTEGCYTKIRIGTVNYTACIKEDLVTLDRGDGIKIRVTSPEIKKMYCGKYSSAVLKSGKPDRLHVYD